MVKYPTPVPWISLSESDSKLYTTFEICEGENHKHLKNTLIYKAKQFMLIICFFQETSTYFRRHSGSSLVKIVETRVIKNRVKYIHCR